MTGTKPRVQDKPDDPRHGTVNGYTTDGCRCDACRKALAASQREKVRRRKTQPKPQHVHGTLNGYVNYGCRCDACRAVWAANVARLRLQRQTKAVPDHVHGTANGYGNYGCRCIACKRAWRLAAWDRRQRKLDREVAS